MTDAEQPAPGPDHGAAGRGRSEHQVELVVDLGEFLPETTAIGPATADDEADESAEFGRSGNGPGDDVRTDEVRSDERGGMEAPADEPEPVRSQEPSPPVDLAVLAGIEADLAAVDQAIEAIDADDLDRSPLLTDLLGSADT